MIRIIKKNEPNNFDFLKLKSHKEHSRKVKILHVEKYQLNKYN